MLTNERQRQYAVETRKGGLATHERTNLSEPRPSTSDGEQEQTILRDPPQSSTPNTESRSGASRYDENLRLRFNFVRNGYVIESPFPESWLFDKSGLSFTMTADQHDHYATSV